MHACMRHQSVTVLHSKFRLVTAVQKQLTAVLQHICHQCLQFVLQLCASHYLKLRLACNPLHYPLDCML
jgi:hypothetical protein